MKKARAWLVMLLLGVMAIRMLWLLVEPLIPVLLIALVIVMVLGFLYHRSSRW
ncbi:hypothetical protein [Streptomyces sp. AC555_RSS877]|uniref:hypothetical protein n=1 Tax=Streptomyces sp. AC555_RSS877 TaxID=2823688 RepID=UPI001C275121|nr:hypothetical protein [Streptomyces sp. AC555_RSS877]